MIGDLNDAIVEGTATQITPEGLRSSSAKWIPPGAVLLAMYGSIGKLGIAGSRLTTNQAIAHALVDERAVTSRYLFWYLKSVRRDLMAAGKGGTQQNISQTVIKALPIPVPPIDEQGRIVEALEAQVTKLEAGVANIAAAKRRLRGYRSQVLASAVAGGDWRIERLDDLLLSLRNGLSHKPDGSGGVPILRISSVRAMGVDLDDVRFLDPNKADDRFFIRDGDLLFTRYNGNPELVGVCGRVQGLRMPTLHPDKVIRATVDKERVVPEYLEIALNTGMARAHIRRSVKTTAGQAGIAGADLKAAPVPVPSIEEQERIAGQVQSQLATAREVERSLTTAAGRARGLRDAIFDAAFSGQLA